MSSTTSSTQSTDPTLDSAAGWAHLVDRLHRVQNGQDKLAVPATRNPASSTGGRMPPPPTPGPPAKKH